MLGCRIELRKRDGSWQRFSFRKLAASLDRALGARPTAYTALLEYVEAGLPSLASRDPGAAAYERHSDAVLIAAHIKALSPPFFPSMRLFLHTFALGRFAEGAMMHFGLRNAAKRYFAHKGCLGLAALETLQAEVRFCDAVQGDTAEVGVYRGHTSNAILSARAGTGAHLGYDTFGGICGARADDNHRDGEFAAPLEEARARIRSTRAIFRVGPFPATFVAAADGARSFAFVYSDTGTHAGARDSLAHFLPALAPRARLVLYAGPGCEGARRAVIELVESASARKLVSDPAALPDCIDVELKAAARTFSLQTRPPFIVLIRQN